MHPEFREAMARDRRRELERVLRTAGPRREAAPAAPRLSWWRAEGRRRPALIATWTGSPPPAATESTACAS